MLKGKETRSGEVSQNNNTSLGTYLALGLFIVLPIVGWYIGYQHAHREMSHQDHTLIGDINRPDRVGKHNEQNINDKERNPSQPVGYTDGEVLHEYVTKPETMPLSEQSEQTVDSVGESAQLATTTIDMGTYQIRYATDQIEVLNGQTVVQTIPWNSSFRSIVTYEPSYFIKDWDVNFDGHLDLGVLTNIGYAGVNLFYQFYTFDPDTHRLVRMKEFDSFESDISNLVNPDFIAADRTITSSMKSAQTWVNATYTFDGTTYNKTNEWTEGWDY